MKLQLTDLVRGRPGKKFSEGVEADGAGGEPPPPGGNVQSQPAAAPLIYIRPSPTPTGKPIRESDGDWPLAGAC